MTPDFADQEAERIITGLAWTYKPFLEKEIAEALRKAYHNGGLDAVHTAQDIHLCEESLKRQQALALANNTQSFFLGFNAAKEAAAKVVADAPGNTYTTDCDHDDLAEQIRALRPEATNGESQSEGE